MVEVEDQISKEVSDPFEIRRATSNEVQTVWSIIEEDSKWLSEQGLNHWGKYYTFEMVAKMVDRKEVYIGYRDGRPIGTITFDTRPPKYYGEAGYQQMFTDPEENAFYITAVAVLPEEQRKGFAGKLLQFTEEEARARQVKWLRLDCRAEVPGLVQFYEKRGFKKVGNQTIDEGEDGTYWLMEKSLV